MQAIVNSVFQSFTTYKHDWIIIMLIPIIGIAVAIIVKSLTTLLEHFLHQNKK